jgi:hypothetical protein
MYQLIILKLVKEESMAKINILYSTVDRSNHIIRYGEFFKRELLKLQDVKIYLIESDAHIHNILQYVNFKPDFIFFDDFTMNKAMYGLEQVIFPKVCFTGISTPLKMSFANLSGKIKSTWFFLFTVILFWTISLSLHQNSGGCPIM